VFQQVLYCLSFDIGQQLLQKVKGPKAQGTIRDEISDLKAAIKGHEKEIKQKWPELGDDF
jgi:hypothetical protein